MSNERWRSLRHALIPAVPVPFRADGTIDEAAQESYLAYMQRQPIGGVAVWAHTGRGLHLTTAQRGLVLESWRAALPDTCLIAGAGGSPAATSPQDVLDSAMVMAEQAARGGADCLLAYAPTIARSLPSSDADAFIVEYHRRLGSVGLPVVAFYLYEAAGGISYSASTIHALLSLESVVGVKIATADSVMTFQIIAELSARSFPSKLLITGEDRFFGYSLMCGAQSALVGMGSALAGLQAAMMQAYFRESKGTQFLEHPELAAFGNRSFIELSTIVDRFAQTTFGLPLQGYIQRMLWVLVELGVIPEDAAHDPWGPELTPDERERVRVLVTELGNR